jgi:hypothetical protein
LNGVLTVKSTRVKSANPTQRRLRLDPPEPLARDPPVLMRSIPLLDPTDGRAAVQLCWMPLTHSLTAPGFNP